MSATILSPEEREQLSTIPLEISDADLVRFFTLSPEYLTSVDRRVKPGHRLDQAAHICILRWLGWSPVSVERLPQTALVALCEQLGLQASKVDLGSLPERTSRLHDQRAREYLNWRKYTAAVEQSLGEWLKPLAEEHDYGSILLDALLRHLCQEKIVRPGLTRLERLVEATRITIGDKIAEAINSQLTAEQKRQLDDLVVVPADETRSPFRVSRKRRPLTRELSC